MALQLKSYQRPKMPIAIACSGSEKSLEFAGSNGLKALSLAKPPGPSSIPLSNQWDVISNAADKTGKNVDRNEWELVTYVYLADTKKQAMDDIESGAHRDIHEYFSTISDNGIDQYKNSKDQHEDDVTVSSVINKRSWIIGTPDDAISEIERYLSETRCSHLCMWMQMAGMPSEKVRSSMSLFAKEVMPYFRKY